MGYDISYHPITEEEMHEWYFDIDFDEIRKNNYQSIRKISQKYGLEEFYADKYIDTIRITVENITDDDLFDKTHGFCMAVIQGLFREFYYTRGSAFSFLLSDKPSFTRYTKPWEEILKTPFHNAIENLITENYSSGVYIPADKVVELLKDWEQERKIREALEEHFSHNRIDVFLKALRFASEHHCGLLEATEVIIPNPMDLNTSECYSNLFNCDIEGPLLYVEAAMELLKEIEENRSQK